MTIKTFKLPLGIKIILGTSILVSLFGIITLFLVTSLVRNSLSDSKRETITSALLEQVQETSHLLDTASISAKLLSESGEVITYMDHRSPIIQDKKILDLLNSFGIGRGLSAVYLLDSKGLCIVSTDSTFLNNNYSFRSYFKNSISGRQYEEMAIGVTSKKAGFYFSSPIFGQNNSIVGVVVTKLEPETIYENLASSSVNQYGNFMLADSDGVVIYSNNKDYVYRSLSRLSDKQVQEITQEKKFLDKKIAVLDFADLEKFVIQGKTNVNITEVYNQNLPNQKFLLAQKVSRHPFYLISEVETGNVGVTAGRIATVVGGMIGTAVIATALLQILFLRFMFAPLTKLREYAQKLATGRLEERISISSGDELESLAENLNLMAENIKSKYGGLEERVVEDARELHSTLKTVETKNNDLEKASKAMLNVMSDLSAEKDRVETILTSIGDGVFVTDTEGKITMINRLAQEMSGYREDEALGKRYTEIFNFRQEKSPDEPYPDFVNEVIKTGQIGAFEKKTVIVRKDSTIVSVLDSVAPLIDHDGKVFGTVTVFRDSTRERELERGKDEFLSVASHQLRTPLGGMRWGIESLLEESLPKETKETIDQLYGNCLRMIHLVNDLLNISRIDQGRITDVPVKTNLKNIINEVVNDLLPTIEQMKLKIRFDIRKPVWLKIDPHRFQEMFENIASNAVNYNVPGGKVVISLKQDAEKVVITVRDTGVGIPKKDIRNIGTKFFRSQNALQVKADGTGLGMYLVKKYVSAWGGNIKIESQEKKGSTVTISLPLAVKPLKIYE